MDKVTNRRVAVTGGRGFIGRHLVSRLLASGAEVRVLTRSMPSQADPSLSFTYGDLTSAESDLVCFVDGADVLYHCAGEVHDQERMRAVHVDGTKRLIEAARGRIERWVQLSSVGAYGPVESGLVTEDWPEAPIGEYEGTKTDADRLVRKAAAEGAFSAVVLRPSIVYGATMRNRSLFQLIKMIDRGLFFFVGKPGASANYVHVEDVVDALLLCGGKQQALGQVFIVSNHCELEEFVGLIAAALKRPTPRLRIPRLLAEVGSRLGAPIPGFPLTSSRVAAMTNRAVYSNDRITSLLGFENRISIEEGVREMVSSFRERG